tara:strand:- start:6488 stop:6739 length:252 start_codon:yes stop_codon:yes gene_type:complete
MLLNRTFIRKHLVSFATILFVGLYVMIIKLKPGFLYNHDGTLRNFGVGYKNRTVIPVWLLAITLAILSYLGILYYLVYPRIHY